MKNAINFFEIPASDFDRAVIFYERLLGQTLIQDKVQGIKMAFFHSDENTVGGAICCGSGYTPSNQGVLFYLNGGRHLPDFLSRVKEVGGKPSSLKKVALGPKEQFAFFIDTEGNRMGVYTTG